MKRTLFSLAVVLPFLVLGFLATPAWSQGVEEQMRRVTMRFVEETGDSVMGLGSWISQRRFVEGASDFDMRLVVRGANEQALRANWEASRRTMIRLIREEFGPHAPDILGRTNLYPPQQLMRGVATPADALETFQRFNTVPNLAHSGAVTADTAAQFSEGLYGTGGETWVQAYERSAGRLFYMNNGRAATGLAELAHLGEGAPIYTIAGSSNLCGQFVDKAIHALGEGSARDLVKHLQRMDMALAKARDLSRMPVDHAFRQRVRNMIANLEVSPHRLFDPQVSQELNRMMLRARAESAILPTFENAGALQRAKLRLLMDGMAARNAVGEAMEKVMEALPPGVNATNAIRLIVLASATRSMAQAMGGGDAMDVAGTAAFNLAMTGGYTFPPALLAYITSEILKEAEASGIVMAAGSQNAWDLMRGIYSAWGRADLDPDQRFNRDITLADLIALYREEEPLRRRVEFMAQRAATRGLGTRNAQADMRVAVQIAEQCWPAIRDAWRWQRDLLTYEYLTLRSEIIHSTLLITYLPTDPEPGQSVLCTVTPVGHSPEQNLRRMDEIIRLLYGSEAMVSGYYSWEPEGSSQGARGNWQRSFTFDRPGEYPVKVSLLIRPQAPAARDEPPPLPPGQSEPEAQRLRREQVQLDRRRIMAEGEVQSLVDVRVEEESPSVAPDREVEVTTGLGDVIQVAGVWEIRMLGRTTLSQEGRNVSGRFEGTEHWNTAKRDMGPGTLSGTLNPPAFLSGIPHLDVIRWFEGHWEQGGDRGRLAMTFLDPTNQGAFHADDPRFTVTGRVFGCTFSRFDRPMDLPIQGVRIEPAP